LVPEDGNWEASVKTIVVVEELIAPLSVVVASPATVPPHCPKLHP